MIFPAAPPVKLHSEGSTLRTAILGATELKLCLAGFLSGASKAGAIDDRRHYQLIVLAFSPIAYADLVLGVASLKTLNITRGSRQRKRKFMMSAAWEGKNRPRRRTGS